MRKIVFVLPLMLAALSCFAEIRVDRANHTEGRCTVNVSIYWNDKYIYLYKSAQQMAKGSAKLVGNYLLGETVHSYWNSSGNYLVVFDYLANGYFEVWAGYHYSDSGYQEILYQDYFYSFNDAKAQFDYLCKKYYNEIPK